MDKMAIWISLFSILIAAISLGWNIYKEIMRPRLVINLSLSPPHLIISVTNLGPHKITLENRVILKYSWAFFNGRLKRNVYEPVDVISNNLIHKSVKDFVISGHPASMLVTPHALDIGEKDIFKIDLKSKSFLEKKGIIKIGLLDSTGKIHWASKKDYKKIKKEYERNLKEAQ
jgi:hypothetical protein